VFERTGFGGKGQRLLGAATSVIGVYPKLIIIRHYWER